LHVDSAGIGIAIEYGNSGRQGLVDVAFPEVNGLLQALDIWLEGVDF
jgi:hypothetical protein